MNKTIDINEKTCRTCKYYEKISDRVQDPIGECLRHAPTPFLIDENNEKADDRTAVWPIVGWNCYCGEWEWDKDCDELIGDK
ncbi:MAG: hypothetical protein ACJAR1_000646 [Rubritalea sp.]|jgi:hypothetical protein